MEKIFEITFNDTDMLKEDMFQAEYGNLILDIGYYGDGFLKLYIIKNYDWDKPLEVVSFMDVHLIEIFIDIFKNKIMSGFYDGNYIVNNGCDGEL